VATSSNYALRVPPTMMEEVKEAAGRENTSINQFILLAVAEKLAAMRTRDYFMARRVRAELGAFHDILARAGAEPPREGDELPDGWLDAPASKP